jgi:hypothetical protein
MGQCISSHAAGLPRCIKATFEWRKVVDAPREGPDQGGHQQGPKGHHGRKDARVEVVNPRGPAPTTKTSVSNMAASVQCIESEDTSHGPRRAFGEFGVVLPLIICLD